MNNRLIQLMFLLAVVAQLSSAPSFAQTVPGRDQWGEEFDSPGAKLTYKEIGRTTIQGRTVITYNLFASGLPKDKHYVLPQAVADALVLGGALPGRARLEPCRTASHFNTALAAEVSLEATPEARLRR